MSHGGYLSAGPRKNFVELSYSASAQGYLDSINIISELHWPSFPILQVRCRKGKAPIRALMRRACFPRLPVLIANNRKSAYKEGRVILEFSVYDHLLCCEAVGACGEAKFLISWPGSKKKKKQRAEILPFLLRAAISLSKLYILKVPLPPNSSTLGPSLQYMEI